MSKSLNKLSVSELKVMLRKKGLSVIGKKATLLKRLRKNTMQVQTQKQSQSVVVNIDLGGRGVARKRRRKARPRNSVEASKFMFGRSPFDAMRARTTNETASIRNQLQNNSITREEAGTLLSQMERRLVAAAQRQNVPPPVDTPVATAEIIRAVNANRSAGQRRRWARVRAEKMAQQRQEKAEFDRELAKIEPNMMRNATLREQQEAMFNEMRVPTPRLASSSSWSRAASAAAAVIRPSGEEDK